MRTRESGAPHWALAICLLARRARAVDFNKQLGAQFMMNSTSNMGMFSVGGTNMVCGVCCVDAAPVRLIMVVARARARARTRAQMYMMDYNANKCTKLSMPAMDMFNHNNYCFGPGYVREWRLLRVSCLWARTRARAQWISTRGCGRTARGSP